MGIFVDAIKERRASEMDLITNPGAFFASIFGDYQQNDAGIPVNTATALTYSPVVACARILAETIAQVPWNVMRSRGDRGADVASDTMEHKLLHRAPNPLMTSYTFRIALVMNAVMHGAGCAELVWNGANKIARINLIPANKVKIKVGSGTGDLYYEIEGRSEPVHMSDMIHIPTLAMDGITGYSLINAHRQGIGAGLAAEKHTSSFLGKGARPSVAVSVPGNLSKDQSKTFNDSIQEAFGGPSNAGKAWVLTGGATLTPVTATAVDAQLIQTREFQVAECARVFRIPGVFLGLKEASTYASAEQFFLNFVKFTIAPWAEAIEQEFDRKLFPDDMGMYTHLDLRGLMRGDAASRVQYYKGMFDMGAMTSDEARAEEDFNPIEGGGRAYVQQNLMPVDMVDEVLKGKISQPAQSADPNAARSIHHEWLEYVVSRMRSWKNYDKAKAAAALAPVFRSMAGDKQVDIDALCRSLTDDVPGEGFIERALARFEEVCK